MSFESTSYRRVDLKGYEVLEELALNLIWSMDRDVDQIWKRLDQKLWEETHNPWVVLQTVSIEKLKAMLTDIEFLDIAVKLLQAKRKDTITPSYFQENNPDSPLKMLAYFSMEFMLSEALPIYSGGLGNVAGDQLKAASDLGLPLVGIGLLYQQGYFRQVIDKNGQQRALYPYNDPGQLPILPLRKPNGEWLRIEIALPGWSLWLRAWQVQVGRVKLYLLDTNDAANFPAHRGITSELYGGDSELRLKQELVLGIGGVRLLSELGIKCQLFHLNEGHAAFAILERARTFMKEEKTTFEEALQATRAGNIFTTHTAVSAGFDLFSPTLIEQYLEKYAKNELGISLNDLLALGRKNSGDAAENFNMAYLAMRGSGAVNGVSKLHGKVSRHIFSPLFANWPEKEVPVGYVTNGIHVPSWESESSDKLWSEACGKKRWFGSTKDLECDFRKVSDDKIWQMRGEAKEAFVNYCRKRVERQLLARGEENIALERAKKFFEPNVLILGFARRFATYKRPNMLLHDPDRLLRLLTNAQRPVQLVIAGKAHPEDRYGQEMIQEWIQFIRRPEVRPHVLFLVDYDMLIAEELVQGVDVWINNPRRPWEACGTSGMKVLSNGGINLSVLDGWWAEAYTSQVGFALGGGSQLSKNDQGIIHEPVDDRVADEKDALQLYEILENQVIPEFYERNEKGVPEKWIAKMRESMAILTPQFSANRAVRQYTEEYYIPQASAYKKRADNNATEAKQMVSYKHELNEKWAKLKFTSVTSIEKAGEYEFEVVLYRGGLDADQVLVELFAEGEKEALPYRKTMECIQEVQSAAGSYLYRAKAPMTRPKEYYTARAMAQFPGLQVPLEEAHILWQH